MKLFFLIYFLLFSHALWACPMCSGSASNPGDQYLVYILAGFILLTYIPFYILYRMVYKNRKANENEQS